MLSGKQKNVNMDIIILFKKKNIKEKQHNNIQFIIRFIHHR